MKPTVIIHRLLAPVSNVVFSQCKLNAILIDLCAHEIVSESCTNEGSRFLQNVRMWCHICGRQ